MVVGFNLNIRRVLQIVLLCLLTTQVAEAQLLWKISKKGQSDSYILGSHHLIPSDLVSNIKGVEEAYKQTTALVGEINMAENSSAQAAMGLAMLAPSDSLLTNLLSNDAYLKLLNFNKEYPDGVLSEEIINLFKPQAVSMFISIGIGLKVNKELFPNNNSTLGIDLVFEGRAIEDKKHTYGLETMEQQLDLLLNSSSIADGANELIELINCFNQDKDAALKEAKEVVQLYLDEDIDALLKLTKNPTVVTCSKLSDEEIKAMLDDRNIDWIPKLDAFMKDESCFIVVGALHLPGKNGMLELLKTEGYTLTPVSK